MASYTTLKNGSRGDDVKKLQQSLISAGYDLGTSGADGIYGAKTQAAVTAYQKANGLSVDGIAGDQTLGSLYGANKTNSAQATTGANTGAQNGTGTQVNASAQTTTTKTPASGSYDPNADEAYLNALSALQAAEKQAPTYANTYQGQLEDLYDRIVNRDKFSYDINTDALYQSMKDQYILGGQQAMRDTMGQAAALTGGYGNSYAQMVGQQTYDNYLSQMNDMIPELRGQALDAYNAEGDAMLQQYSMLGDLAGDEYAKYSDAYNRWLTERDYLQGQVDAAYDRGLNDWEMNRATVAENRENLMYLITASGYNPTDDEIASAGMTRPQVDSLLGQYAASASSSGGRSGSTAGSNPNTDPDTDEDKITNNYFDMRKELLEYTKVGITDASLGGIIEQAEASGKLNKKEVATLLQEFDANYKSGGMNKTYGGVETKAADVTGYYNNYYNQTYDFVQRLSQSGIKEWYKQAENVTEHAYKLGQISKDQYEKIMRYIGGMSPAGAGNTITSTK